jgi:hypothetical protein
MGLIRQRMPADARADRQRIVDRRWRWAALILGMGVLSIGCNPGVMSYFMLMGKDDKNEPDCQIAEKGKEVKLVIVAAFAGLETRPELAQVDYELAERLNQVLKKRFQENKEKVTIVSASQVKLFQSKHPDWREWSMHDIGKHFGADYVLSLEINRLSLYEKGSFNRLYHGQTEIGMTVTEVAKPVGEDKKWDNIYTTIYPNARGPIPADDSSVAQFRMLLLNHIAKDVSKRFAAYPNDERYMIDD